jgi:hypothetical protein
MTSIIQLPRLQRAASDDTQPLTLLTLATSRLAQASSLEWNLLHALTADMGLGLDGQAWQCMYRAS